MSTEKATTALHNINTLKRLRK